jgi:hypothetical protein
MPPVGFERTISAGERQQTYALDREATGTGNIPTYCGIFNVAFSFIILLTVFPDGMQSVKFAGM